MGEEAAPVSLGEARGADGRTPPHRETVAEQRIWALVVEGETLSGVAREEKRASASGWGRTRSRSSCWRHGPGEAGEAEALSLTLWRSPWPVDSAMPSLHPSPWEAEALAELMVGLKAELKEAAAAAEEEEGVEEVVAAEEGEGEEVVVVEDLEPRPFQSLVNVRRYRYRSHSSAALARSDCPASPSAQCRN